MAVQSNSMISVKQSLGSSALKQVQDLAQMVALANKSALREKGQTVKPVKENGDNGLIASNVKALSGLVGFSRKRKFIELRRLRKRQKQNQKIVSSALESLERDSTYLLY
jgi:hypothetical protein